MSMTKDKNQGKEPFAGNTGDSSNSSEKYKNDELRDNAFLFGESNLEKVVDKRFEVCLAWYVKGSRTYKYMFYILMIVSTICPIVVTTLNTMDCTCARIFISFFISACECLYISAFSCTCTGEVDGVSERCGI